MRHDVMQQGTESCLNAVLGVHGVLDVAELVQQVEGFARVMGLPLKNGWLMETFSTQQIGRAKV